MGFMQSARSFISSGVQSIRTLVFRREYVIDDEGKNNFDQFKARAVRYAVLWAMFENTLYDEIHNWAVSYKTEFGLYRYTRNIYNPAYRVGTFWQSHIWGGKLDPKAGDGKDKPSAIPIVTPEEMGEEAAAQLRSAISLLWKHSNWKIKKDLTTLYGNILGDVLIRIIDDKQRQKTYLVPQNPIKLQEIEVDEMGNVKAYILREERTDPTKKDKTAVYIEVVGRGEDNEVLFETFMNGKEHAWDTNPTGDDGELLQKWTTQYGFVPLILAKHIDVGKVFGWAEMHSARSKVNEMDDIASQTSDNLRKLNNTPYVMAGMTPPKKSKSSNLPNVASAVVTTGVGSDSEQPQAGRESIPTIWAPNENAQPHALVEEIDLENATKYILSILQSVENDYPELSFEKLRVSSEASGTAIRQARQPVVVKAELRRQGYDDSLVRAQQMAIAIGGEQGYPGYEGFNLDSYEKGDLDHTIGERPVFAGDRAEQLEDADKLWDAISKASLAGEGMKEFALKKLGFTDDDLADIGALRMLAIQQKQEDFIPLDDQ